MSITEMPSHPQDVWGSGAHYEPYVGRWSRRVARKFITSLAVPPDGSVFLVARAWAVHTMR